MWFAQTTDPALYQTTTVTTTTTSGGLMGFFAGLYLLWLVLVVVIVIAEWKMFVKAGEAGWKALIPFYNMYVLFRIAGRNGWWFLALLVPVVNIFVLLMLGIDLAKHFGKSTAFGVVALWLFSAVGYLILGFDSSTYVGPKHD